MNKKLKNTLHIFGFEFQRFIFYKRWMFVFLILVVSFFAYLGGSTVLVFTINNKVSANIFDAVFNVFGYPDTIFIILIPLFLIFISDIPMTSSFEDLVFIRVNSRKKWLWNKILLLMVLTVVYLLIILFIVFFINSFALPFSNTWSEMAVKFPERSRINPQIIVSFSPISALIRLVALMLLGLLSIGLLTITASLFFNNAFLGFFIGTIVSICGSFAYHDYFPQHFVNFFITNHMIFNLHSFGIKDPLYPPYSLSIVYWIVWILLFTLLSLEICKRRDFIPGKSFGGE